MRFLHTADWHLGRTLFGERLLNDQAAVLQDLLKAAVDNKVEAIIIAGDIYDRAVPPTEAVDLFDEILFKLANELKLKVLLIAGNHDSSARLNFGSRLMEQQGVFVAGKMSEGVQQFVVEDKYGEVAFTMLPYAEPALVKSIYQQSDIYDEETAMQERISRQLSLPNNYKRRVAIAHAFIAGGQESESERPLSVGGSFNVGAANFKEFNYTALGHLHNMQRAGGENIRYAGSLLKYSFDEAKHKKGCYIVDIDAAGHTEVETILLKAPHEVSIVEGYFADIINDRQRYPKANDYICVRLKDERPQLDAQSKLREVYPNFLTLERPNMNIIGNVERLAGNYRKMTELELFESFFTSMTGQAMQADEEAVLKRELDKFMQLGREV